MRSLVAAAKSAAGAGQLGVAPSSLSNSTSPLLGNSLSVGNAIPLIGGMGNKTEADDDVSPPSPRMTTGPVSYKFFYYYTIFSEVESLRTA